MLRSLLVIEDTPHRVAFGCAIGTFVAFMPIVGIQMLTGGIIAFFVRANIIATLPPAWITNPLTIVPIFYGVYQLGALFTGGAKSMADISALISQIDQVRIDQGLWASMKIAGSELADGFFIPMTIGGTMVGLLAGAFAYWLTWRAVTAYQHRKRERRLHWLKMSEPKGSADVGTE
jgi:uncharacterized protein (DUF2062 family)